MIRVIKENISGFLWDRFQEVFGSNSEKLRIYRNCVNPMPGEGVLDFGCATGLAALEFQDVEYLGVDINQNAIQVAKSKYPDAEYPGIKFIHGDIFDLTLPKFEHILFAGTGHHIKEADLCMIIERLAENLSKNGKLHFIDIVKVPEDSPQVRFMYMIDQGRFVRCLDQYNNIFTKFNNKYQIDDPVILRTRNKIFGYSFIYYQFKLRR